jgi:hypothetical protein
MPIEPVYACNMNAMTAEQRKQHEVVVTNLLKDAASKRIELADGYTWRYDDPGLLSEVAEFVNLERLCCPFFTFTIGLEPDGGPLTLNITGAAGIKAFIVAEFGLES